jgi:hypothetical protein
MVQVSCAVVATRDFPLAVRTLTFSFRTQAGRAHRAERNMAGRKWPSDGVVTVGGPEGRLACAVIATSGFVAARPAELIAGEAVVRADVEEIKGKF